MGGHEDPSVYSYITVYGIRYALTDTSEIMVTLPYQYKELHDPEGGMNHIDEPVYGIADISVMYRKYASPAKNWMFSYDVGITIPTGAINSLSAEAYLEMDEARELNIAVPEHSHLQNGTGAFDPILSVSSLYKLNGSINLFGSVRTKLGLYHNDFGLKTSSNIDIAFGPVVQLNRKLSLSLVTSYYYSGKDRLDITDSGLADVYNQDYMLIPNSGKKEWSFRPNIYFNINDRSAFYAQMNVPFSTQMTGDTANQSIITEVYGLTIGYTWQY